MDNENLCFAMLDIAINEIRRMANRLIIATVLISIITTIICMITVYMILRL